MATKTNEQALERCIEKALTGFCVEEIGENQLAEPRSLYRAGNGFYVGNKNDYDPNFAIDKNRFWHFLENTQSEELEKLQRDTDWRRKILERLDRTIKKYGVLYVLKKGLRIDDAHLIFMYQLPMASSSQTVKENFERNEFSVTRQVHYNLENKLESIDMVIFLNGLPIATLELKNPWTHQTARVNAIKQYKNDRDIRQPLLQFGRCLVHFAVDTDEVYMCTKLNGKNSYFLPFNKGSLNHGKGNPPNKNGHKTAYSWEEVLTRESLANIIQHFIHFKGKPNDPLSSKTLIFPRYHQLNVVRKLIKDIAENGIGKTYLIQHSAGSGKSNSITWAAYQFIEIYPENENLPGAKSTTEPLFDSVIVVTDRRLLDKQLRDNIKEFSEVKNIVAPAYSSSELKDSLESGKRIIITTIQKFPYIVDGIANLSNKRFAVLIDEAHSSQSGTAAGKMNQAIGAEDNEEEDYQDKVLKAIQARKMKGNASYFAFTATPKNTTLERFGTKQPDGTFSPFDLYSMKQAIEEGFILDVLSNYTTYKSYYEIEKSIEDNPWFDTAKAQKKLKRFVEKHNQTITTKAKIMMKHFLNKVYNAKKLKGKAKAMVVTQDIESAIRYYKALNEILKSKGNPFKIAIAFSGEKTVDGVEYTEAALNGFSESETKDYFDKDEYRILVVANKYLTGFDQPKLSCMYIDKRLRGVLAVQALSRLNRSSEKLGKKTEDLFILDFYNEVEDIKSSFDPFYTSTSLSKATDVNVLHELESALNGVGVYELDEVEDFINKYFAGEDAQYLSPIIDTAAERFNHELELEEDEKKDFKVKAKQFVKIYGQMAAIIPFEVISWERLFWFLKFLIPKLIVRTKEDDLIDEILESVDLSTYGIERTKLNYKIGLDDSNSEVDPQNSNPRGVQNETNEKNALDEIIKVFNERYFQQWDKAPEDQKETMIKISEQIKNHSDFIDKVVKNNDVQNKDLAYRLLTDIVMKNRRKDEIDLYKLYAKDAAFNEAFVDVLKKLSGVF
ncbi:type I restriction endonuclease subunit R [Ornithobacterium rhinotracheale]|uniref:type I restriction endonuclease subunit R n=1 Tax=Ornithobacterium rhinotracheale TaxID=28251 RepID=UPI00129C8BC0|nr:type I restriction endonuclease [Ornithobacterium rhinotracheale]MRJ07912.1 type I restriction endonuclease subunit R [Ornithobacterium rhinotracheale]UOH78574.1 type I restriction endonuclease [Ornithobacterium rhinotracheale]